jgi:hypothetical protein
MPNIEEIILEKNDVTDRISTQVRIIAVGLLATTWSLLIGKVNIFINTIQSYRVHFILISIISVIVLMFDFLQYECKYLNIKKKIKLMNDKDLTKADYDEDIYYKLSVVFFVTKQLTLLSGIIYFITIMFIMILA